VFDRAEMAIKVEKTYWLLNKKGCLSVWTEKFKLSRKSCPPAENTPIYGDLATLIYNLIPKPKAEWTKVQLLLL